LKSNPCVSFSRAAILLIVLSGGFLQAKVSYSAYMSIDPEFVIAVTGAGAGGINQSATGEGAMDGTSPNGKVGGFVKNAQDMKTGNGNVPGGKMGVKNLSKVTQNSKTAGPVGSGTGDKAGQTSVGQAKSPLNGAPNRNA
jgi:hypothetical protein